MVCSSRSRALGGGRQDDLRPPVGRYRFLSSIDTLRWREPRMPIATYRDCPPLVVNHSVMVPTQQDGVAQAGLAAFGPVLDVMGIGPSRRATTSWERASTIARQQRFPYRRGDRAMFSTDVERYTFTVEDHRRQRGIAGQKPCGFTADRTHPLQVERARITPVIKELRVLIRRRP